MTWVTWHQHRLQVLTGAGLICVVAVLVAWTGGDMRTMFAHTDLPSCLARSPLDQGCLALRHDFRNQYGDIGSMLTGIVGALPVLAGAPLLAREYETGTYQLAWTQSITRRRWIATKVGLLTLTITVGWAVMAGLMSWWLAPVNAVSAGRFGTYEDQGIVPVAYAVFAFALGAAAGALVRRAIAAIAITLIGYQTIHYAISTWLRPRFATPLTETWDPLVGSSRNDLGDWSYGLHVVSASGRALSQSQIDTVYHNFRLAGAKEDITAYLSNLHLRFADYYQPATRFTSFQLLETGIYLTLAALLLAITISAIRRHPR